LHPRPVIAMIATSQAPRNDGSNPLRPWRRHMDCHVPPRRKLLAAKGGSLRLKSGPRSGAFIRGQRIKPFL
jgi:hypothetical protein